MRRIVTISIEFDPIEYNGAEDTPNGAIDLVIDMLLGNADLPTEKITMSCENVTRITGDEQND